MSIFGYLAAGAADGLGKAAVSAADSQDKATLQKELLAEKQAGALELATQRAQDRADRERENILLRAELGGSKGAGGKAAGINLFQLAVDTPPEKQGALVETVRGFAGEDAANVLSRIFGKTPTETATPTTGDVTRYDRTVDENGQSGAIAPASATRAVSVDMEKGRVGLQRLMTLVMDPAKYDDFAKGEARTVGTDAVTRAVATGKDGDMRQAGAVNMALEGKDRFAVQGDSVVDKALGGASLTPLGNAKAADERSSAEKNSAAGKKYTAEADDIAKNGRGRTGGDKPATTADMQRQVNAARDELAIELNVKKDEVNAAVGSLQRRADAGDKNAAKRLEAVRPFVTEYRGALQRMQEFKRIEKTDDTDAPATSPAAPGKATAPKPAAALPLPREKAALQSGKVYQTSRGPAKWNGTAFEAQ